ncbi:polyamine ABC transporter ATP-binding protein [Endozoicomonas numazuensis]|uniref:Polyamine ABC transporter ATP-binding protein n=1 Tax=Endozoicomonas numazuensis TaxID=1137799 RepID=A0A081NJX0_9GAMM|nr:polyamine ABC transporter ATP-binding protein [Endozoicomonas numazuensis]
MSEKSAAIEVSQLTMKYGSSLIQQNLNFSVQKGDVFVIMGGSGCGKSTLLKHMIGLYQPAAGTIAYDGRDYFSATDIQQLKMRKRWGVTYQSGALFSAMTLAENVSLPLTQYTRMKPAEMADLVRYKLALVGLAGFEDYYPSEISGGMAKRAGLARAMALDPEVLFFDEPSAGLDPLSAKRLDDLILQLSQSLGVTIVIVTHELESIFAIGSNGVFLDAQTKTQLDTGAPSYMLNHSAQPLVRDFLSRGQGHQQRSGEICR